MSKGWQFSWTLFLVTLAVSLSGVLLAQSSTQPVYSLLGYMMVAFPFGVLLGTMITPSIPTVDIVKVLMITTVMVAFLGVIGAIYPGSLESWGVWLFGSLMLLLGGLLIVPIEAFFGVQTTGAMTWLDIVGILLFGAYVLYDINRAMRLPRTLDNSIDAAVAIYLDFANIFLRILLIGRRK
jgi:FtsH-binding integral membrane protein